MKRKKTTKKDVVNKLLPEITYPEMENNAADRIAQIKTALKALKNQRLREQNKVVVKFSKGYTIKAPAMYSVAIDSKGVEQRGGGAPKGGTRIFAGKTRKGVQFGGDNLIVSNMVGENLEYQKHHDTSIQELILEELLRLTTEVNQVTEINKTLNVLVNENQSGLQKLIIENENLQEAATSVQADFYEFLMGREPSNETKVHQYVPVEIYLDTDSPKVIAKAYSAIKDLLRAVDLNVEYEFPPVKGSWFKGLISKTMERLSKKDVKDRLKKLEHALELSTITKVQSEVDKNKMDAVANFLSATKEIPNLASKIGSLVVIKITDPETKIASVFTKDLSDEEMIILNKNPSLITHPAQLLDKLSSYQLVRQLGITTGSDQENNN
jgi:hypothetical protein